MQLVSLYRPVGPAELRMIAQSGFERFPPRLPEQATFDVIVDEAYACEVAERCNAREEGGGFVTRFAIRAAYLARFAHHLVGARPHEEYRVPADEQDAFAMGIVGAIEVVREFHSLSVIAARKQWFDHYVEALDARSVVAGPDGGPYRCPCCGCKTLGTRGQFEICPVCFWEDDGQDDADADVVRGGPNGSLSLRAARDNYHRIGASDERALRSVRPPRDHER